MCGFIPRMHVTLETGAYKISGIGKTEWKSSSCAHTPFSAGQQS